MLKTVIDKSFSIDIDGREKQQIKVKDVFCFFTSGEE